MAGWRRREWCGVGAVVLGVGVLSGVGDAVPSAQAQARTQEQARVFAPVADTRVESTAPTQNFGGSSVLKVDGSPEYLSLLRFELTGLGGPVKRAMLRLYATDATTTGPAVHLTGGAWQEGAVTFQDRPEAGSFVAGVGAVQANTWVEWDVTSAVQGQGAVGFSLVPTGTDGTIFSSREASNAALRPQLVVTVESGAPECVVQRKTHTLLASDGITVGVDSPNTPVGAAAELGVDDQPLRASYLRFTVPTLPGSLVDAQLRLYTTNPTDNGPRVYATAKDWSESSGVTWNTRPATTGGALDDKGALSNSAWAVYAVGAEVRGAGVYSFGLLADSADSVAFVGRTGSNAERTPQLILTTEETVCTDPGEEPPPEEPPPSQGDWTFYGTAQGGPQKVLGVSADAAGNLWVAGGEQGLFVLEKGKSQFRRFTMADGLRPYGYMHDGSEPPGTKYLNVISVTGGPAGVAFVGYAGKKPAAGMPTCEDEWDQAYYAGRTPDASIYKSGDADRVTLSGTGIQVVHYDLSTGPNKVAAEMRGREKLCSVLRIAYDPKTQSVWFGANHGFALGKANFTGYSCAPNAWDYGCAGVMEHVHPAINAWNSSRTSVMLLTDSYHGVSVTSNGDVWFGGANRSTRFRYGTTGNNYWAAQSQTEDSGYISNRFDIWPDAVGEPSIPTPEQRVDDHVSGMAVMEDQSVWVGSFTRGLALLDASGQRQRTLSTELVDGAGRVSAVAADPLDGSVWAGANWGEGLSRVRGSQVTHFGSAVLPTQVHWLPIKDIQVDRSAPRRRILVAFEGSQSKPGVVGVYTGP